MTLLSESSLDGLISESKFHVKWLLDNYETADGSSLPRCQLYDHYRKHCSEHRMDAVNAASFGKLIRSVFLNLKTRRLGTRGNSKYHYYGIKIKETSVLNTIPHDQEMQQQFMCSPPMQTHRDVYADTVNQVAAVKYLDEPMMPAKRMKRDNSSSSSSCR
uniref:RFX-type winged-helix domain-containing protein n=1 Tax=Caenorhabditis japonica TaxID=281687 RepID=A0A8R1ERJ7_CAEJA